MPFSRIKIDFASPIDPKKKIAITPHYKPTLFQNIPEAASPYVFPLYFIMSYKEFSLKISKSGKYTEPTEKVEVTMCRLDDTG